MSLKVNTDSWHYRLRGTVFESKPKDLCSYFWSCVAAAIAMGCIYAGLGIAFVMRPVIWFIRKLGPVGKWIERHGEGIWHACVVVGLALILGILAYQFVMDPWKSLTILVLILGIILGVVLLALLIIGIVLGIKEILERRPEKPKKKVYSMDAPEPPKEKGTSTLSLFWAFLRAKKRKACPLIEVIEDEEVNKRHLRAL